MMMMMMVVMMMMMLTMFMILSLIRCIIIIVFFIFVFVIIIFLINVIRILIVVVIVRSVLAFLLLFPRPGNSTITIFATPTIVTIHMLIRVLWQVFPDYIIMILRILAIPTLDFNIVFVILSTLYDQSSFDHYYHDHGDDGYLLLLVWIILLLQL